MVEEVDATETFELRHRVLGRGRAPADLARPDDQHPDTAHLAVRQDGRVVATGTVRRRPSPDHAGDCHWQIRGMAVEPELRGRGLGTAVLVAIVGHVADRGGGLLWCYARIGAVTLYQRAAFTLDDAPFDDPVAGRQVAMSLPVPPPA